MDKALLTREDLLRGQKELTVALKNDSEETVIVRGVPWKELGELSLAHRRDPAAMQEAIYAASLPDVGPVDQWLNILDTESRLHVQAVCMEFAYGHRTQKKRRETAQEILKAMEATASPESSTPTPSACAQDTAETKSKDGASQP